MIRVFGHETSLTDLRYTIWQALIFFMAFAVPAALAQTLAPNLVQALTLDTLVTNGVIFAGLLSTTMFAFGLDARAVSSSDGSFLTRLLLTIAVGGALVALASQIAPNIFAEPKLLLASLALAFVATLGTRRLSPWLLGIGGHARRVIILGSGESARRVKAVISESQPTRYELIGSYAVSRSDDPSTRDGFDLPYREKPLAKLAQEKGADEIIVALDDRRGTLPIEDLMKAKLSGVQVTDLVAFYERECSTIKVDKMYPSWVIFSADFQLGTGKRIAKRAFDLTAALVLLGLVGPLLLLVAVASLVESRGRDPILYHQDRVGYGGRTFRLHKFRSMAINAEGDGKARWASANDDRVTRLGRVLRRYRLDELPQLFNILAGDMSLVGPRPERPEFVQDLTKSIPYYGERHCVKPGLAGWAQLMYPYGASVEDAKRKLEYDLYYIKHTSVLWDLVILLRTLEAVLLGEGVR